MSEKWAVQEKLVLVKPDCQQQSNTRFDQELPAELNTGYALVDFEHKQLLVTISLVRNLCSEFESREDCTSCSLNNRLRCESSLIGVLGDLLAFMLEHFQREENAMRDSQLMYQNRAVCEAHIEDHADISYSIQQIVSRLDINRNVVRIRELNALLVRWVERHMVMHDQVLAQHVLGRWAAPGDE